MRISVLGDYMIDEYVYTKTSRISPEAPVLIADVQQVVEKPGGAGNVARVLLNLQNDVQIIGFNDCYGKIDEIFQDEKCTKSLIEANNVSIRKTRIISDNHHLLRIDDEKLPYCIESEKIDKLLDEITKFKPNVVVISDYNKGLLRLLLGHKKFCSFLDKLAKKTPVIADLKPCSFLMLNTDIKTPIHSILPNKKEMMESTGFSRDYYDAATFWYDKGLAQNIIVTRGEEGASLIIGNHEDKITSENIEVVDVCGCGDVVTAVYSHLIALRSKPIDALKRAVNVATFTAQKLGTHPISLEEFNQIT